MQCQVKTKSIIKADEGDGIKQPTKNMKRNYFYCELDRYGQRTGEYFKVALSDEFIIFRGGCKYLALSVVHSSGYIEEPGTAFLFTSEEQAQRAALS